jgi:hypothetical protein
MNFKQNKKVNLWLNTLENRTEVLRNAFGMVVIVGLLCLATIIAFSQFNTRDIVIVGLLCFSIIGCVPYIEVAVAKNSNTRSHALTLFNWKDEVITNGEYNVLSSNLHFLQPIFPAFTILSFLLFLVHKLVGEKNISYNTILFILILQIPFNNTLGLNPMGVLLTRQQRSKYITQNDLKQFVTSSKNTNIINKNQFMNHYKKRSNGTGTLL